MKGWALGARATGAAKAASLRDAISLRQRWELISRYARSMTFWPVTGRQRWAHGRGFLADDLSTRSGHESIDRCPSRGAFATRKRGCRPQEHRRWFVGAQEVPRTHCPQIRIRKSRLRAAGCPNVAQPEHRNIVNDLLLRLATGHGKVLARAWQCLGKSLAMSWQADGVAVRRRQGKNSFAHSCRSSPVKFQLTMPP
jgi:hypothetical protein